VYTMPESPRYLIASKQYDKARMVFQKIANFNGLKRAGCDQFIFDKEIENQGVEDQPKSSVSWREIWGDKTLRTNLWASCLLYSEASFNFYLLTFYLKYFPGNLYENSTYFACSDLIAFLMVGVFLNFTSMKTSIRAGAAIALTGGLLYLFLFNHTNLVPMMVCFSRVGQ
jgi:hypothetical protein